MKILKRMEWAPRGRTRTNVEEGGCSSSFGSHPRGVPYMTENVRRPPRLATTR